MRMHTWLTTLEILGAIIGAGFASGREIAAFFARFGWWSLPGIAMACVCAGFILHGAMQPGRIGGMPACWQHTPMERVWKALFALLLTATGGAMLAAAGEAVALAVPVHHARLLGMAATLALAVRMLRRPGKDMGVISQVLVVCLLGMMLLGFFLPPVEGRSLRQDGGVLALAYGAAYGGFNAALAAPAAALTASRLDASARKRCAGQAALLLGVLLLLANAVLLCHPGLQGQSLPYVVMLSALGKPGYYLCLAALYLAVWTTLCASLRGMTTLLPLRACACLTAIASLLGFEGIVAAAYPVLGVACMLLLLGAEWSQRKS